MRKRRKFYRGVVNHVYQSTIDGEHLFYCTEDYLVFFTILSVCARSAEIQILELCLMHNHVHILIRTETCEELSKFINHFSAWFVHEYNSFIGRSGKLLKKNFGSAPKWEEKRLRSSIIYIGNNPVEKRFCKKADEYRWNFLKYGLSDHPYSEQVVMRKASSELRKAIKEVDIMNKLNLPLKYAQLIRFMKKLSEKERDQLTDYIISQFSPIDYKGLMSYFKSYNAMISAMESTTGDDYDIRETRDDFSIKAFNEMTEYLHKSMPLHEIRKVTAFTTEKKIEIFRELQLHCSASEQQICRFLHLKMKRKNMK